MGFVPQDWTRLDDLEDFPYLGKCRERGITTVEELLGQSLAEWDATREWLGCSDDAWMDLLAKLIGIAPRFALLVWTTNMRIYGLGALPPDEGGDGG